ncbi:MAG: hypothetical protein LUC98_04330 [Lachnospiraceae bacterium]|nr:hypothetical protein [Lachnospiraceae bacterium]
MRDLNVNIYGDINLILSDLAGMAAVGAEDAFSEEDEDSYEECEDGEKVELEEEAVDALLAFGNELLKMWIACENHKADCEEIPEEEKEGRGCR